MGGGGKKRPYREYLAYTLSAPASMPAFFALAAQAAYFTGFAAVHSTSAANTIYARGP